MKIKDLFSKIGGGNKEVVVRSDYDKTIIYIALKILEGANKEERKLIDDGKQPTGIMGIIIATLDPEKIKALKQLFEESVGLNNIKNS